jgi:hypothetical protein
MPIEDAAEYRRRAERCLFQAESATDFAIRMQWIALSEDWRSLAESVQRERDDVELPF